MIIFGLAALVSAFLLFWVEPLFTRLVLPMLGGSPSVWNTCLMFFQTLLLLGYLYAHVTSRYLTVKRQAVLHLVLLAVCIITLPVGIPAGWIPPADRNVIPWLLRLLTVALGAPFLVLSATAPLVQRWFSTLGNEQRSPYPLYAASNAGSFLGLLAFPLVIEPRMGLINQTRVWMGVYLVAVLLAGLCVRVVLRDSAEPARLDISHADRPTWLQRLKWIALAFVPSSLLLGVTTFLSTDVASTPLLWVIPLALYLLTFVIVFAQSGNRLRRPASLVHALLISILAIVVYRGTSLGFRTGYSFHLLLFLFTALVLHGELAASKPSASRLTEYYLWMAFGGALGGTFTALVVPFLFRSTNDYFLMLVVACFLRPTFTAAGENRIRRFVTPAFAIAIALVVGSGIHRRRENDVLLRDRSFFGIYRVTNSFGPAHIFYHGSTIHGAEFQDTARRYHPITYYHPNGPVGEIFDSLQRNVTDRNIGAVGLGTGSILCYSRPGEKWTFFEIDPHVVKIAADRRLFSFVSGCAVRPRILLGDARLTIAREPAKQYSLLILDAFSSDAIPVHLLTRQAFAEYRRVLRDDGLLLIHISNRRLNLEPVVGALAADARFYSLVRDYNAKGEAADLAYDYSSDWVILARRERDLAPLTRDSRWRAVKRGNPSQFWTDDYSNLLSVIKW